MVSRYPQYFYGRTLTCVQDGVYTSVNELVAFVDAKCVLGCIFRGSNCASCKPPLLFGGDAAD